MTTTVNYNGVELEVVFRMVGAYYPATLETPEEQPEISINEIRAGGVDIMPLLTEVQEENIYNLLMEKEEI